jgi:hypothetical protein
VLYRALADAVLVAHLGFVLFAILGGLLVLRWRRLAWLHVPAVAWGVTVELTGWICPLTPLESALREAGGGAAHSGDFLERFLFPILYSNTLTRSDQIALGSGLLLLNALVYGWILYRARAG